MRLIIERGQEQQKGFFGGNKGALFHLTCRVELSEEEQHLVEKYRVGDHVLASKQIGDLEDPLRVGDLTGGTTMKCKDVATLLGSEEVVRAACSEFKVLLTVMASFGGREVVEF